ncbi:MAG: hypothetical protein AB8B55_18010 [Mariniblastus sp.]
MAKRNSAKRSESKPDARIEPLTVTRWRKMITRKSYLKKLSVSICETMLYEFVARELVEMGPLVQQMPRAHRILIREAYKCKDVKNKPLVRSEWNVWYAKEPYFELADGMGYYYRAAGYALRYAMGYSDITEAVTIAAQKSFEYLDWQTQVRIVHSILAVEKEFGKLDPTSDDPLIANDWLKDRGMEPLVFEESIEDLLKKPSS